VSSADKFLVTSVSSWSALDAWTRFIQPIHCCLFHAKTILQKASYPQLKHTRSIYGVLCVLRYGESFAFAEPMKPYLNQAATCKSLIFCISSNPAKSKHIGAFYCYVNRRMTASSGVGPLRLSNDNSSVVTEDPVKAQVLNDYFCRPSVSIDDDGVSLSFAGRVPTSISLDTVDVSRSHESILKFLNKGKAATSGGPNGIPLHFEAV